MDLGLRRILVIVLGIIGGIAGVYAIFFLLNSFYHAGINYNDPLRRYGSEYFVLTALPLALLVMLWLDYFMRTGIIPEVGEPPEAKQERKGRGAAAEE